MIDCGVHWDTIADVCGLFGDVAANHFLGVIVLFHNFLF